jgi:hypothetical protein
LARAGFGRTLFGTGRATTEDAGDKGKAKGEKRLVHAQPIGRPKARLRTK